MVRKDAIREKILDMGAQDKCRSECPMRDGIF